MIDFNSGSVLSEEDLGRRRLEQRRERIYSWLFTRAKQRSMDRRIWFCISEIADECARVEGKLEIDPLRRAFIIDLLRESVQRGEFNDPQHASCEARCRLAFLHTSPNAKLRFERGWAENRDQ